MASTALLLADPQNFQYTPPEAPLAASRWALVGQVFYFLLIFAFVIGLTYLMTRFLANKARPVRQSRHLRVIDQLGLAPGKSVHLIDCGDRVLIIGCGEKELNLLGEIVDPLQLEAMRGEERELTMAKPGFEDYLRTNLNKMPGESEEGVPQALASTRQNIEALLRRTRRPFGNGRMP